MSNPNSPFAYLYRDVQFYIGFKAVREDGSKVNRGVTLPRVWNIHTAIDRLDAQREYVLPKLQTLYSDLFKEITGRDLQLSDLRVSFSPADELLNAVMLDDIEDTCAAHIYVETSPNNFQGHYMLNRPATEEEAMCVIRMLRDYYGGDPGAAKSRQGRRFVMDNLSSSVDWSAECADVDFAVKHYPAGPDLPQLDFSQKVALSDSEKSLYRDIWVRKLRASRCLKHPNGDDSSADFGLAMYLLERAHSPAVARAAILCSRAGLIDKKGSYTAQYLNTTVESAASEFSKKVVSKKRLSL